MLLGIPRGFFYYDYIDFVRRLFAGTEVVLVMGQENDETILARGTERVVDEACFPVKLFAGQVDALTGRCDRILIPRIMKDVRGRWLCPKLLGIPELSAGAEAQGKCLVTDPLYLNDMRDTRGKLWELCKGLGVSRGTFQHNFRQAYHLLMQSADGRLNPHVEAAWEFVPSVPRDGEILLPNIRKILLSGHCYNVYDQFANGQIMEKLDDLAIEAVTEKSVDAAAREQAVEALGLTKAPFWEALVRALGTALCVKEDVEGIIYLSSFSCGPDAFIIEMLKAYVPDLPLMVLKLDEHRGQAGIETRLEAFADLLEKRCAS